MKMADSTNNTNNNLIKMVLLFEKNHTYPKISGRIGGVI